MGWNTGAGYSIECRQRKLALTLNKIIKYSQMGHTKNKSNLKAFRLTLEIKIRKIILIFNLLNRFNFGLCSSKRKEIRRRSAVAIRLVVI